MQPEGEPKWRFFEGHRPGLTCAFHICVLGQFLRDEGHSLPEFILPTTKKLRPCMPSPVPVFIAAA